MTGYDVYKRALILLGYVNSNPLNPSDENLLKRVPAVLEQICLDLKIPKIERLSDEISACDIQFEALIYGVAMMIALIEGDGAKNEIFTKIYNSKRALALSKIEMIQDKLPTISDGVD